MGEQASEQKFRAEVYVSLRPSVLDPAGAAVEAGIRGMGYTAIEGVRIGKYVELTVGAATEAAAREQLEVICDRLLTNPVIENYRFQLQAVAATEA